MTIYFRVLLLCMSSLYFIPFSLFASSESSTFQVDFVITSTSCADATDGIVSAIPLGGTAPYFFEWSNTATTQTITQISTGIYHVTVTDITGCTGTGSAVLTATTPLVLSLQKVDGFCGNLASVGAMAQGGVAPLTYTWSNGETSNFLQNLSAGDYSVTVSDQNGCTITDNIEVQTDTTQLRFDLMLLPPTCTNASDGALDIQIVSGTAPFSYYLNGILTSDFTALAVGNYTLFVEDALGCSSGTTVFLQAPPPIQLQIISNDVEIEIIPFNGFPPYQYIWNTGDTTALIQNLTPNTYTVTVSDQNGCTTSQSIDVLGPLSNKDIVEKMDFRVFPNPCSDYCMLDFGKEQAQSFSVQLTDIQGRIKVQQSFWENKLQHRFDFGYLESGIYLLQVQTSEQFFAQKIVVR